MTPQIFLPHNRSKYAEKLDFFKFILLQAEDAAPLLLCVALLKLAFNYEDWEVNAFLTGGTACKSSRQVFKSLSASVAARLGYIENGGHVNSGPLLATGGVTRGSDLKRIIDAEVGQGFAISPHVVDPGECFDHHLRARIASQDPRRHCDGRRAPCPLPLATRAHRRLY